MVTLADQAHRDERTHRIALRLLGVRFELERCIEEGRDLVPSLFSAELGAALLTVEGLLQNGLMRHTLSRGTDS